MAAEGIPTGNPHFWADLARVRDATMGGVPEYRCSECGLPRHKIVFAGDREPSPLACPEHLEAPLVSWTNQLQTACLYFHKRISDGATMAELRAEVEGATGNHLASLGDISAGWALFERWGCLPEGVAVSSIPGPGGLFGPRVKGVQS